MKGTMTSREEGMLHQICESRTDAKPGQKLQCNLPTHVKPVRSILDHPRAFSSQLSEIRRENGGCDLCSRRGHLELVAVCFNSS